MSIASAIQAKQQQVADAYTAISNKGGTLPVTQDLSNMPTAINSITSVNNTNLSVTPLTTAQSFTVSAPYTGYYTVSVSAVTSSIDSNIKASNIKSGVSILGVSGTVTELNGSSRSVTLTSASGQTFNPETGKNAITSITVAPNNQAKTITPSTSSQSISVPSGYSGFGALTVNAVTSSIDANIQPENIKKDIVILGTTGTFEGGGGGITNIYSNYIADTNGDIGQIKIEYSYTLGYTDTEISTDYALQSAYENNNTITDFVLGAVKTISAQAALSNCFLYCTSIKYADLRGITTISGYLGMARAFYQSSVEWIDLSNLTTVSGERGLRYFASYTTSLKGIDLRSLRIISGSQALQGIIFGTKIATLSFPSLTSTSFGSYTDQFNNMLQGVTGCTVHFPSNLQSVIGSWSDVTAGFGGTNTTVLFDLPATT